ncbi:MAG: autotransporter domain-containing protein [Paracoccaceae bacterium]|nr:autotransporter domain-containing protein [Paracoccaceae bacterium]
MTAIRRLSSCGVLLETGARKLATVTSTLFVSGLLVLAGVTTHPETAFAQAQESCPLPPGVTPPPDPPITAREVVNSETLKDFALAVRDQFVNQGSATVSAEQLAFAGCRLRLEGGPFRSGSTYIVTLTPDGRVFLHAKEMSLSARSLKPAIYAGILTALGVPRTVLAGLNRQDPTAQAALLQILQSQQHGPFDLTNAVPGASGYAAAYVSGNTEQPMVLLVGFDLNASHLKDEVIDYGNPKITAEDVVDRATLKEFVTEALRFLGRSLSGANTAAESRRAFANARLALRDPNGPWRHGSVYLYLLDRTSNIILVHGAFPDRFELRPLVPTVKDAVTGKYVLTQVLEAASSNREGGFVKYYFDDPSDDTDSADIPKLGYAREFTRVTPGTNLSTTLVIGSGVYLRGPETTAVHQNTVIKSVLPQMMRAMTASTVDAVSSRIQQATSDVTPARDLSLAGGSTLQEALLVNRQALESGTLDPGRLLEGSSFVLAFDGAGTGQKRNLTFWGSGDYRKFSGGNSEAVTYDGNVMSANLGLDAKLGANVLAGVSLARATGKADYTGSNSRSGELTSTVTSVNPYMNWQASGGINLWATVGYGSGEVELEDSTGTQASDLSWRMVAAGVNGPLVASDQLIAGGTTNLRVKGETAFTRAGLEGSDTIDSMTLNASRHRLMLEGSHVQDLASGSTFTPSIEIGLRNDGGDGETGTSVEAGGGLRYNDQATGLTVEARARTLLAHSGDYEEWGVSGLVKLDPGPAGVGLAFSVQPAWGQTASGVQRLWETGMIRGATPSGEANGRLDANVSYGMAMFGGHAWARRSWELGCPRSATNCDWVGSLGSSAASGSPSTSASTRHGGSLRAEPRRRTGSGSARPYSGKGIRNGRFASGGIHGHGGKTMPLTRVPREATVFEVACFSGAMASAVNGWNADKTFLLELLVEMRG